MRHKTINLFCIPFAGGSYYSYAEFPRYMADFIHVIPVEPPGRGRRLSEPLLDDIHEISHDLFKQMICKINRPYAIFGHSVGAWLGYLLMKRIMRENIPGPVHFFASGRGGPSKQRKGLNRHQLPRKELVELLMEFDGMPLEVFENEELMDFFEPIIRADFRANDGYVYEESDAFDVPITVIIGLNEKTSYEEALAWQKETTQKIEITRFPGGHFFIFQHLSEIGRIISEKLEPHLLGP